MAGLDAVGYTAAMKVLTVTRSLLDLLAARHVYHGQGKERWQEGVRIAVPDDCAIESYSHLYAGNVLPARLGMFSYSHSLLAPHVSVGRFCSIGTGVAWMGDQHPMAWVSTSPFAYSPQPLQGMMAYYRLEQSSPTLEVKRFKGAPEPVRVGNDVWIGDEAMIRGGVTIGDGAVIGARALVTRDVPPYAIVVGSPAKVQRLRFGEPFVQRLLALEWWRYRPEELLPLDVGDPEGFVSALEERLATDPPRPFAKPPLTAEEMAAACDVVEQRP